MSHRSLHFLAASLVLAAPHLMAQDRLLRPSFVTPNFHTTQPEFQHWEFSRWDCFYTPHTLNGSRPQNRNYPDIAAPNGYAAVYYGPGEGDVAPNGDGTYRYVGPFNGDYVWDLQSRAEAQAAGFDGYFPTNPNPANPRAIFHSANPTIRQHASSAFIIGPGYTGNIYSPFEIVSYILEDAVDYDIGSVVFQFQNQGRDVDLDSLRLRYTPAGGEPIELEPTDQIIEREAFASHAGFTFTSRVATEWDVAGLGIRNYEIVWKAAGTSCSIQDVVLDTTDAYVRDKGLPAKRLFTGTSGADWSTGANWIDADGGNSAPLPHANVVFQGGTSLNIGATSRTVSMLESTLPNDFTLGGTGPLHLGTGYLAHDSVTPRTITFDVPVNMTDFNFFDIGANVSALLVKPFSGDTGFEKRGPGALHLAADNTFTGALFVSGGELKISGSNPYGSTAPDSLDLTYLYLGKIELESTGELGAPGVKVSIGSTPYEIPGETTPSHLVVKGQRQFSRPIEFTGGFNPKILTFTETGAGSLCNQPVTFHNEVLLGVFGEETSTGNVEFGTPLATDKVTFSSTITGGATLNGPTPYALRKTGAGTLVFSSTAKAYKHQTHVVEGTLLLESGAHLTGGNSVTVNAGATLEAAGNLVLNAAASVLTVDGVLNGSGEVQLGNGPTVTGSGTIAKSLAIASGTTLSPGNSVGTLHLAGTQIWSGGGRLRIEVDEASNTGGSDRIEIEGPLVLSATPSAKFAIELRSLTLTGVNGPVTDFNPAGSYVWTIAAASGGISGFDANAIAIDAAGFEDASAGTFTIELDGNHLLLRYTGSAVSPTYSQWAASLPSGKQGENDDADGDGQTNLVEFALGTDGNSTSETPQIKITKQAVDSDEYAQIEFAIAEPARPGTTIRLAFSPSLEPGSWQSLAVKPGTLSWRGSGIPTEGAASGNRKPIFIRDPDPIPSAGRRFYRLEIRNDR